MAAKKPASATRPAAAKPAAAKPAGAKPAGGRSRDKGTRGGRPDAGIAAAQRAGARPGARPAGRQGNGQARAGRNGYPGRAAVAAQPAVEQAAPAGPPAWLQWSTWVLALGGLGVSTYLTIAHFNTSVSLACPATSTINCEKVTTSPQSYVFGIPVAVLGLAFYLFLAVANSPWAWRLTWPPLRWARVASVVAGILFVLYLVYTELFTIGAICLWCTSVHVITFLIFGLVVFSAAAGYGAARPPARIT